MRQLLHGVMRRQHGSLFLVNTADVATKMAVPNAHRRHRCVGVNTAPKDRDALYDSIVRWARRDGWTGKLFLRQIGPGKVHKAGPGTAAAAMDHNLGRPY